MAITPIDLLVDGVSLKTFATNVENLSATLRSPGLRSTNTEVPGRDGSVFSPYKRYTENSMVWNVWLRGGDKATGRVPTGQNARIAFFSNHDAFLQLMAPNNREINIVYVRPDGTARSCRAQVTQVIDWAVTGEDPLAKVSLELTMSDPFWYAWDIANATLLYSYQAFKLGSSGELNNTYTRSNAHYTGGTDALGATAVRDFAARTAPLTNMYIDFCGPFTTAKITSGDFSLTLNQALVANELVRFYTDAWAARKFSTFLTSSIHNLCTGPSFEYSQDSISNPLSETWNSSNGSGSTTGQPVTQDNSDVNPTLPGKLAQPLQGTKFAWIKCSSAGDIGISTRIRLGAGSSLRVKYWCQMVGLSRVAEININWLNAGLGVISNTVTASGAVSNSTWTQVNQTFTSPALTVYADVRLRVTAAAIGEYVMYDNVLMQATASDNTYYDGDTDSFSAWTKEFGKSESARASYFEAGSALSVGSASTNVPPTAYITSGTVRQMEIPATIQPLWSQGYGATPQMLKRISPILPAELKVEFTGAVGLATGVRITAALPYLTG